MVNNGYSSVESMVAKVNNNLNLHNKLMEQGYIEAAASKINQKLSELRESGNERLCRRWIWELIQNANDCSNPSIDINIKNENDFLYFSHNGKPFDYKSLMNIITQISTKESNNDDDATGKFGTGFITTHLLSEKVLIKGAYIDTLSRKNRLEFCLNRSGRDIFQIKEDVAESLENLKKLSLNPLEFSPDDMKYETNFIYNLKNADKKAINDGKKDLDKSAAFVLAFVETIDTITYNDIIYKRNKIVNKLDCNIKVVEIIKDEANVRTSQKVLICFKDDIEIATIISIKNNEKYIEPFDALIPKLFCRFPLVGTEEFCLPFVVNSSKFSVEEQRDGIYENSQINKELLFKAIDLYENMLEYVGANGFKNIYNICFSRDTNNSQLQKELLYKIKNICNHSKIIDTNTNELVSMLNSKEEVNLILPDCNDNNSVSYFWDLLNSMSIKLSIPSKSSYNYWTRALGSNFSFADLCKIVEGKKSVAEIRSWFNSEKNMYEWLSKFYNIAFKLEEGKYIRKYNILLNQNGKFNKNVEDLYIDNGIDEDLIAILLDFEVDIKEELISKNIQLPEAYESIKIKVKSNKEIVDKIAANIRKILVDETQKSIKRDEKTQKTFNKIMIWFLKLPEMASELFLDIYEQKHRLCSNDELMEKFQFAEETEETLKKFNIKSIDELNERLINSVDSEEVYSKYNPDDLLIGLAIDNLEELEKNNNLESVKYLLKYNRGSNYEAFKKVEELVERSKRNVINYLNTLKIYDVTKKQELSKTVYGDIYKNGQRIKVVVRPCDSDMIILFYQSELDVLDDNDYELWIDNGVRPPRQLTFGDILITTGIRVIPLKNLF
ncbi:MAG: hypothetical protein K0R54_3630 [Clostridiaceae bacterium]|jgi:hypothetical protein|nr:hypothetical protein [Clostridiaceae bacterium]